jgi:hypothetical protein
MTEVLIYVVSFVAGAAEKSLAEEYRAAITRLESVVADIKAKL